MVFDYVRSSDFSQFYELMMNMQLNGWVYQIKSFMAR